MMNICKESLKFSQFILEFEPQQWEVCGNEVWQQQFPVQLARKVQNMISGIGYCDLVKYLGVLVDVRLEIIQNYHNSWGLNWHFYERIIFLIRFWNMFGSDMSHNRGEIPAKSFLLFVPSTSPKVDASSLGQPRPT